MKIASASEIFEKFAVGFLLFSAAGVTAFARSTVTWQYLSMPIILILLAITITALYKLKISYNFAYFLLGYITLFIIQTIVFRSFHVKQLFLYPLNFWVAYCFVRAMRERFLSHVEELITVLAGISVSLWTLDLLSEGSIRRMLSGVLMGTPYSPIVESYIYFQTFINEGVESYLPRNSGFAWEPGAFAVFCCFGLMINFYRYHFRLTQNYRGIVLIIALLSTQSTTGYSILLIYLLLKLWHDLSNAKRVLVFPGLTVAIVVGFATFPFMQSKVEALRDQDLRTLALSATQDWNVNNPIAAQRFLSFKIDFADFLNNPLTGYGGEENQMLVRRESYNIVSVSGIGKILARFGVIGFAFFLWATVGTSLGLSDRYGAASPILLAIFILMVAISYSLIEQPLFLSIWCYRFFDGTFVKMRKPPTTETTS